MSKRVRVRDFYYDAQDRIVLQGGDIGPDGQVVRGTEEPKRNGLQYLYGGVPHSPGEEFEMSDDHCKQESIGHIDSTLEWYHTHAERLERIAGREQQASKKAADGNWFAQQSKQDEDKIRAQALSRQFESELAREHIERALGTGGKAAGDHLTAAITEERAHATAERRKLEDALLRAAQERESLEDVVARDRAERQQLAQTLADQAALLAELKKELSERSAARAIQENATPGTEVCSVPAQAREDKAPVPAQAQEDKAPVPAPAAPQAKSDKKAKADR